MSNKDITKEAVPSLEEVKNSLPVELTAQRKALEAHIQAWFLERQTANSLACDLEAEVARLREHVARLETTVEAAVEDLEGAEALAERRGEALWEDKHMHDHANAHCTRCMNAQSKCRAAIATTPEAKK